VQFTKAQSSQKPAGYNLEKYLEEGTKILELYKKEGTYFDPNPDWIERRETISLINPITKEQIATPFTFQIDLITKDGYIIDHKTSSSGKGDQSETNRIQGIAYTMAYRSIFGKQPKGFIQNLIVKQKVPKFIPRVFKYTEENEAYVFDLIKYTLERIGQKGYMVDKPALRTFYPCPIGALCDLHRRIK
jgi:hypothetical protein